MRFPWKRRGPSVPNRGRERLLNRITAANVTETQERKQTAGWRMVGEDGMRGSVREGLLAAEEYLLRDDGMGGGGTTSRTSGISVMHGFGSWVKSPLFQMYTNLITDSLSSTASELPTPLFFNRLKQRR